MERYLYNWIHLNLSTYLLSTVFFSSSYLHALFNAFFLAGVAARGRLRPPFHQVGLISSSDPDFNHFDDLDPILIWFANDRECSLRFVWLPCEFSSTPHPNHRSSHKFHHQLLMRRPWKLRQRSRVEIVQGPKL